MMRISEYLRMVEASDKYIKGFPKDTVIHSDGLDWSKWNGYLALVTGPTFSSYTNESEFDPLMLARRYCVRYALTLDRKSKIKPERSDIGYRPQRHLSQLPSQSESVEKSSKDDFCTDARRTRL